MPASTKKKKKDEYPMLDAGEYVGVVTKAEDATSSNGNKMIKTSIMVPFPNPSSEDATFVHDNIILIESCAWRIPLIAAAVGCDADKLLKTLKGSVVKITVSIESHVEYGDKNVIEKWAAATDEEKEAIKNREGSAKGGASDSEAKAALAAVLGSLPTATTSVSSDDIPF